MREIPLTHGKVAIVDDEDYDLVKGHTWHARKNKDSGIFYAGTVIIKKGTRRNMLMHRLIINPPSGMKVDHKNHDGLDNRRENLRVCTQSQNCANRRKRKNCSSRYKGVSFSKPKGKWQAYSKQFGKEGKIIHIGYFLTEQEAAAAYNEKALEHFGEFAHLNKIA